MTSFSLAASSVGESLICSLRLKSITSLARQSRGAISSPYHYVPSTTGAVRTILRGSAGTRGKTNSLGVTEVSSTYWQPPKQR